MEDEIFCTSDQLKAQNGHNLIKTGVEKTKLIVTHKSSSILHDKKVRTRAI